jgi:NAD+ diphosphatase
MTDNQRYSNPFSSAALERRAELRNADDWQAAALADRSSRFVIARGSGQLVQHAPVPGIAFQSADHALVRSADESQLLLLGWFRGARCVLVESLDEAIAPPAGTTFEELRPLLNLLPADEAAVLSCARGLLLWRARHRHCGVCGAPTAPRTAGHALCCTSSECGAVFFPRIDPAVIVLVSDGDQVLLGRQASWPAGRYSTLAGFVETGESLEDAVIREVFEETGVRAQQPRYFASQPWPFPSSLMLGYHATASKGPVVLDGELEDARWFDAAEIEGAAPTMLPARHAIARRLIEHWFQGVTGRELNPAS